MLFAETATGRPYPWTDGVAEQIPNGVMDRLFVGRDHGQVGLDDHLDPHCGIAQRLDFFLDERRHGDQAEFAFGVSGAASGKAQDPVDEPFQFLAFRSDEAAVTLNLVVAVLKFGAREVYQGGRNTEYQEQNGA